MIVAELLFIAFVVGILTETWLGFVGTFIGLYALYRFTRLSALLSLALSLYWGLLGYHVGASTGEIGAGPLLAVLAFAGGAWVHRNGFVGKAVMDCPIQSVPVEDAAPADQRASAQPYPGDSEGEIIDADYRVVS